MHPTSAAVTIRPCREREELKACEAIHSRELLGVRSLRAACDAGGILLGAWVSEELAGFVFSYRVETPCGRLQHSHLLAIRPRFRGLGLAYLLKVAQATAARQQGAAWIVWTFDPLEAVNAQLNVARLGVNCRKYFVDFYGTTGSPLHAGLETDRLLAEWTLEVPTVTAPAAREHGPAPTIIHSRAGRHGFPEPVRVEDDLGDPRLALPIPSQVQELKRSDLGLARAWRQATRRAFQTYLGRGYRVGGFDLHGSGRAGHLPAFLLFAGAPANPVIDNLDFSSVPFRLRKNG
jgi:predicted GNAT superfamily acetyltransferase